MSLYKIYDTVDTFNKKKILETQFNRQNILFNQLTFYEMLKKHSIYVLLGKLVTSRKYFVNCNQPPPSNSIHPIRKVVLSRPQKKFTTSARLLKMDAMLNYSRHVRSLVDRKSRKQIHAFTDIFHPLQVDLQIWKMWMHLTSHFPQPF